MTKTDPYPGIRSNYAERSAGIFLLSVMQVTVGVLGLLATVFTAWLALQQYLQSQPRRVDEVVVDIRKIAPERKVAAPVQRAAVRTPPSAPQALAALPPPAQVEEVGNLVDVAAYGGGAVMTGTGLMNFEKHVDDPSSNELRKAVGPGVVGIGLLAFPTMEGYIPPTRSPFEAQF